MKAHLYQHIEQIVRNNMPMNDDFIDSLGHLKYASPFSAHQDWLIHV